MSKIHGIIPPMVTPFDESGEVDEAAHRAEVRFMVREIGVPGVAVCGSTGEGQAVTTDETRRITGATVEEASGRATVITGIITDSTRMAIKRGKAVADLGVAALQVTPVHYLFRPDDDSSVRHFDTIAQATGLPVIIYNVVPWSYLSPDALARILREADGVIGVKQSAEDMKSLADLLLRIDQMETSKDVRILSALDALLYPSFQLGAHGAIAAILTAVPQACVDLWHAVKQDEHARALDLHKRLLPLWDAMWGPNLPASVKTAMRIQGRDGGVPRAPMQGNSEEVIRRIEAALASLQA